MRRALLTVTMFSLAACSASRPRPAPNDARAATAPASKNLELEDGDRSLRVGYRGYRIRGFEVLLSDATAAHEEEARAVLGRVDESLADAVERFGPERSARLRAVRIWIEWGDPSKGPRGPAEFHQSRDWLAQNGYDVDKEHGIEINDTRVFLKATVTQQPFALLHEFAHAYDALAFQNANPAVGAAYRAALTSGQYDAVPRIGDVGVGRAYALTDEREYFAETSEAYLAINDFYPFVREDLESADPIGFRLMTEIWGLQPKRAALSLGRCEPATSAIEGLPSVIVFRNAGTAPVHISWLDSSGARTATRQLGPGAAQAQPTYVGHVFEIATSERCIGLARATPGITEALLP